MRKEIIDLSKMNEGDPIKVQVATWVNRITALSDRKIPMSEAFVASAEIVRICSLRKATPLTEAESGLPRKDKSL